MDCVEIQGDTELIDLGENFLAWTDTSSNLEFTPATAANLPFQTPSRRQYLNVSSGGGTTWVHSCIEVTAGTTQKVRFVFGTTTVRHLEIHLIERASGRPAQPPYVFDDREEVRYSGGTYPGTWLTLHGETTYDLYLLANFGVDNASASLQLRGEENYRHWWQGQQLKDGLMLGITLLGLLLSIVIAVVAATAFFRAASFYAFLLFLVTVFVTGIPVRYWGWRVSSNNDAIVITSLGMALLLPLLFVIYLERWRVFSWLRQRWYWWLLFLIPATVVFLVRTYHPEAWPTLLGLALLLRPFLVIVLILVAGIVFMVRELMKNPQLEGLLFLFAYGGIIVPSVATFLLQNGVVANFPDPKSTFTVMLLWQTAVLTVILFLRVRAFYRNNTALQLAIEQTKQEKEFEAAKTRLYANISHEFRTPLTVIRGALHQISGHGPVKQLIYRNGEQLLDLVNQLLDLDRLDAGQLKLEFENGDVVKLMRALVFNFHSLAREKDITLSFHSEVPELITSHSPFAWQRIVSNLVANALKFTKAGGEVRVTFGIEEGGVSLKVADDGIGMSEVDRREVFGRFRRGNGHQEAGSGIGLTLCRELARQVGGTIEVESELGVGSTFLVRLPLRLAQKPPNLQGKDIPNTIDDTGHSEATPLILIVEDHEDVRNYIIRCLKDRYRTVTATDGKEGLAAARERVPDFIISDVMMPEMDGFALSNQLKSEVLTSHIPLLLLTARADRDSRLTGLRGGAEAYLTKPFDPEELLLSVDNLLRLRRDNQRSIVREEASDPKLEKERAFLALIEERFRPFLANTDFGVPEMSREMGMSRSQLFRKLKALTDRSIAAHLRYLRLTEGRRLLRSEDLTVSEVAYRTGFKDPAYFSRTYVAEFGEKPSETGV